ncbi:hypothetical protein Poli38472_000156 [Pythium oligandrum]|uniref:SEC7 domain-containing protein n=1 Tax=Pythium oligandrum TaxID=41045 RepID=A0A8K1CB56_PYTOL|nr:hypothetical protein Poli38472_000156 [Pythium oligandrum]|eukprot:TMW60114.1 hypothetical protein Poli38472_000156 [Pythium oligandrum]
MAVDMAVRSVLLSDVQSVLSIARRRYGYLLVSQQAKDVEDQQQSSIFQGFTVLRTRLQRCENLAELSASSALRPFLDLIRHEHTSSTLTGAALEAVQNFLQCWNWKATHAAVSDVLSDIVDAVSQCRFQETNAESDQNVLVLVVHVLYTVLTLPCASKLSDHSMWQLVESLYALSRANRNDPHITLSLRSTATSFLHRAVEIIFQNPNVYAESVVTRGADRGFGLPCAIKIVGFLCQKLQPRGSGTNVTASSASSLPTRREVMLSFSLMQQALTACNEQLLADVPSLMMFIKDDLCSALLRYCRLGASVDMKIPVLCLGIIRLLWTKLRPLLKMQFEALINGVFCHTLHWTIAHLDLSHPIFPQSDDVTPPSSLANGDADRRVEAVREEFTGELITLNKLFAVSFEILDCLVDLLAEPTILPDLYVNYDCDGNRSDLMNSVFDLLSHAIEKSHAACQETEDEVHFMWARAMGELAMKGIFNSLYVLYTRGQHKPTPREVVDNSEGQHADATPAVTAEVLYRKRQRKKIFQRGIQEFNRKPLSGIKYLQQNSFLPSPLDTKSLATFLRSLPPGLNKASVGIYLGAMGKEVKDFEKTEIHEADTIEFHRDVLRCFVRSFNFEGESIVAALRMFLASFRLPGEAQQIDRILNTFSEQVFEQSRDRFLMASVDVAYLLSFSLIMLNTDLHNPNIRPEKKMKLDDFIKNNRNYGEEVSKKQDLPNDFLTELYDAIAKEQIKTCEDDGKHGEVTMDRWKDLLIQAESHPLNSRLITHQQLSSPAHNTPRRQTQLSQQPLKRKTPRRTTMPALSQVHAASDDEVEYMAEEHPDQLHQTGSLFGKERDTAHHYDHHIFELVKPHLVRAFSSVFLQFVRASKQSESFEMPGSLERRGEMSGYLPEKNMLQLACNGFVLTAAVASHHRLLDDFNQLFTTICSFTALYPSATYPLAYNARANGVTQYCLNQSAPVATAAMLKLVGTCARSIRSDSWTHVFHAISTLREFRALPDRVLYAAHGSVEGLLSAEECVEMLALVYRSKEELERREALKAREASGESSASGFFSGVAWLMSAFDGATSTAASHASTNAHSSGPLKPPALPILLSPVDMALSGHDLVIRSSDTERQLPTSPRGDRVDAFVNSGWIRQTLLPYRLESVIEDVAALPASALVEVVKALDQEITSVLTVSAPANNADDIDSRRLTPAGCVFFEHLLASILGRIQRDNLAENSDDLWDLIRQHYFKLLTLLRPILLKNQPINGINFENASFTLEKALEGLFSLVWRARSGKAFDLAVKFLTALVDVSVDDELVRPYLAAIMSGLKRSADAIDLRAARFDRGDWLTVSNLIGWAVEQPHASTHAFAFVEKLVASEVWLSEDGLISVMDLYTRVLMFALTQRENATVRWPSRRPMELLSVLYDRLHEDEVEVEEEERLRQLGGMALVCRRHVQILVFEQTTGQGPRALQASEHALAALEYLGHMVKSSTSRSSLTGGAWLDVLSFGLLNIGSAMLHRRTSHQHAVEEGEAAGPFVFYERNLPQSLAIEATGDSARPTQQQSRRRRPSAVKDPNALKPHIIIVELLSWVVCEQLDQLLLHPRFAMVWDELIDVLLSFIDFTKVDRRDGPAEEMMSLALERRSVLSAHEEIVEHVNSIIRRLTVLQDRHEQEAEATPEGVAPDLSSARFHALMHVLVEKCQSKGAGYFELLFPSKEEATIAEEQVAIEGQEHPAPADSEGAAPAEQSATSG